MALSSTGPSAVKLDHIMGEYLEKGAHNGRPYFTKRNDTAKKDFFLFFSGRRWAVSDVLGKKSFFLISEIRPVRRDFFLIRLLDKAISRSRLNGDSDNPPQSGWQYVDQVNEWQEDKKLLLEWRSPESCRRMEVVRLGEVGGWRDLIGAWEKVSRTTKKELGFVLFMLIWGNEKRRK